VEIELTLTRVSRRIRSRYQTLEKYQIRSRTFYLLLGLAYNPLRVVRVVS